MAHIGQSTRTRDGYRGQLKTLTLDANLTLVPAEQIVTENADAGRSDQRA